MSWMVFISLSPLFVVGGSWQRTGTALTGGCKGLPVGTASTGASAASEERSRLCRLPAPCQPSAEEPPDSTTRGERRNRPAHGTGPDRKASCRERVEIPVVGGRVHT